MHSQPCQKCILMQKELLNVIIRYDGLVGGSIWLPYVINKIYFVFFWDVKEKKDLGQAKFVFVGGIHGWGAILGTKDLRILS